MSEGHPAGGGGRSAPAPPAELSLAIAGPRVPPAVRWWDRLERPGLFQWQLVSLPILALLCFQVVPILHGVVISLQSFTPWSPEGNFVGLRNYRLVLTNPLFYRSALPNTFLFLVAAVGLELSFGLGIALLINRPFPGARAVKTLLLFPLLVAPVVAGLMFYWMFHSEFGLVNQMLRAVGLPDVLWFNRPWSAFGLVVLADVWTWTPWFTLLMYSGLQSLPPEPFEAARIDGANVWQIFRLITIPLLYPVLSITLLIRSFDAFRVFDVIWTMTGGGPGNATETVGTFIYRLGYLTVNYSEGAAAAMTTAAVIMVVGVLVYGVFARVVWGRRGA